MKKFTTFLAAAAMATMTFAQVPTATQGIFLAPGQPAFEQLPKSQQEAIIKAHESDRVVYDKNLTTKEGEAARARALSRLAAETPNPIMEQPEGELVTYSRDGYNMIILFWIQIIDQEAMLMDMVKADDGKTVYLDKFVSNTADNCWVKGTIEGDKLHVPLLQYVQWMPDVTPEPYGFRIAKLNLVKQYNEDSGKWSVGYEYDDSVSEITFSIKEDGSYVLDMVSEIDEDVDLPKTIVGEVWPDLTFNGDADYETSYVPFTLQETLIPDDVETQQFVFTYKDNYGDETKRFVNVAFKDDKVYIAGLVESYMYDAPEGCAVGTMSGNKITFEGDQYLGREGCWKWYFAGVKVIEGTWEYDYEYMPVKEMTIDADKKEISGVEDEAFFINQGYLPSTSLGIWMFRPFIDPNFKYYKEVADTPVMPYISNYYPAEDGYPGSIYQVVVCEGENGNYLDPSKMTYMIWVKENGVEKKYVFTPEEYVSLEEEMIEIPYAFESYDEDSGFGIRYYKISFNHTEGEYEDVGIQSVYYGGGERHESQIGWFSYTNGVDDVTTDSDVVPVEYYSIDGIRYSTPANGINIVRMSDGSVRKVIVRN